MAEALKYVAPKSIIAGWDFGTDAVKCVAFDLNGKQIADAKVDTDLWMAGGVSELNLMQLEGQVYATLRMITNRLREAGRLHDWVASGISATHHTAGRIDADQVQVRRAIFWNDHSLGEYHARGLERLGGQEKVQELVGGPWAIRYSLSHLVKDEQTLPTKDWRRTYRVLSHGSLAAGCLTGNFDVCSVSSAASTGIMDLRTKEWRREMLNALEKPELRELAWKQLPRIIEQSEPVGHLRESLALENGIDRQNRPLVFPTSDDQQAGLIGGGAVDAGQMAVILGNSAVVNSSSNAAPSTAALDLMRLNWGPYLWMRCYNNGAQFLNQIFGKSADWTGLEAKARKVSPGCTGTTILPFYAPEPSVGVTKPRMVWIPNEPADDGVKFRACLEALAYLIALGVRAHEEAGQSISRLTVSGGIARSSLMCEILAAVLNKPVQKLEVEEGPALGAALTALAALENHRRSQERNQHQFAVADAVAAMVKMGEPIQPKADWSAVYSGEVQEFEQRFS